MAELTQAKFEELRKSGFTTEQIADFWKQYEKESAPPNPLSLGNVARSALGPLGMKATYQPITETFGGKKPSEYISKMPVFQNRGERFTPAVLREAAGTGLGAVADIAATPLTYALGPIAKASGSALATIPATRRFLARQLPILSKGLLNKVKVEPIFKDTPYGKVDITKPFKESPDITFQNIKNFFSQNKDFTLEKTTQATQLLDETRSGFGKAVGASIEKFKDTAVNPEKLKDLPVLPNNVLIKLKEPMYGIEYYKDGSVKNTIGNLHKVDKALGDFMSTKDWYDSSSQSKQLISQAYGKISQAIKDTEPSLKEPITAFHNFMNLFRKVNHTLRDREGTILESRLRKSLGVGVFGPERTYTKSWEEISKVIPQMESIMKSVVSFNRRELTKKVVGLGVATAAVGGVTYGIRKKTSEALIPIDYGYSQ